MGGRQRWTAPQGATTTSTKATKTQRRKHQINSLAITAAERELELLDKKGKPWLLEVNHATSFSCVSPLDLTIKLALLRNGPLAAVMNANGMEHYIHGVVGCDADGDCEAGNVDHHAMCDSAALDHSALVVGYG